MRFCPDNVGNWSSSRQDESELSPRSIQSAISRFSRGPVAGNQRQHFFDSTGSNTITLPDQIDKTFVFRFSRGSVEGNQRQSADADFLQADVDFLQVGP